MVSLSNKLASCEFGKLADEFRCPTITFVRVYYPRACREPFLARADDEGNPRGVFVGVAGVDGWPAGGLTR